MTLRTLESAAQRLVTPELATGEVERWPETEWSAYAAATSRRIQLDPFETTIDEAMRSFERHDARLDAWVAPRLHRALRLSRREASNPGAWRFLAVVRRPDFIRHRWKNDSWATMRARFWSRGVRHTSNTFSRLWWIAELTRDRDDYSLTERVLASQMLAIQLFVRNWSWHRPAVVGAVEALEDASRDEVERSARELSRVLATVPLEGLDATDVRDIVLRFRTHG